MKNSDYIIDKLVEGDKNKQIIYDYLNKKSSSRRVAYEELNLTKHQFDHYIGFLIENKYVKVSIGKCVVYGNNKVHILVSNPHYPFKARTKKELLAEKQKKEEQEKIISKYTRVIRNLDRPSSDFAYQRKKTHTQVSIQSSFNIL